MKIKGSLTEGPIGRTLFFLALPMVFGVLSIVLFNLADTYFVAKLGTAPLAALGFVFPIMIIFMSISIGLGAGLSAVLSQEIGRGNLHEVRRLVAHGLFLGLCFMSVLIPVGIFTIDPLFRALGASEDVLPLIHKYMVIWYPGMFFLIMPMIGNNAIRATGDTRTPSIIMMVAALTNIVLDPLFIFGIGFFPQLGIAGAAVATLFGRFFSLCASFSVLYFHKRLVTFSSFHPKGLLNSWKRILHIGIPAMGTQLLMPLSMMVFVRLVSQFGNEAVAAVGAGIRIEGFAMIPVMALGAVITPFIGQNWGAKRWDRSVNGMLRAQQFAFFWGLFCAIAFIPAAPMIAKLFSTEPEVYRLIKIFLWIVPWGYALQGGCQLVSIAFNAVSRPFYSILINFIRMFVLFIPLAWLGGWWLDYKGLLGGVAIANSIAGLIAIFWVYRVLGHHRNNQGADSK